MQPEAISIGETVVDILPAGDARSLRYAPTLKKVAGGASANVAAGLARLGVPTGLLSAVGQDEFGLFMQDALTDVGVDLSGLAFLPTNHTALSFVSFDEAGNANYLFLRQNSAALGLSPDLLDHAYIGGARAVVFGSLFSAYEPGRSTLLAALDTATRAGALRVYDVNLRMPFWESPDAAKTGILALLDRADVVKMNRHEGLFLTGSDDPQTACRHLWRDSFKLMVVTLDARGSYYYTPQGDGVVHTLPVNAIDSVGAGDGFVAGLTAGLLGYDLFDAAATATNAPFDYGDLAHIRRVCAGANAVGGLATTRSGAIPAMPTRAEVAALLQQFKE